MAGMSDPTTSTSVKVETSAAPATEQHPCTLKSFLLMFFSLILSRTLWVAIFGIKTLYGIYWIADREIWTYKEAWQAQAHTQLFTTMFAGVSTIVLGYCSFTRGSTGLGGFVQSTFSRTVREPGDGSFKSDPDDHK